MNNKKRVYTLLATWALALSLAACGGSTPTVHKFSIEAKEFAYSPAELTVKVGDTVEISLQNKGTLDHDLSIASVPVSGEVTSHGDAHTTDATHEHDDSAAHEHSDIPVHVMAKPGNMGHLIFTPSAAGEYAIVCTVAGHKEAGMVGRLIVTE